MRDPAPENIEGEMVERHVFEHRIDWGYVAIAIVAVLVLWQFGVLVSSGGSGQELTQAGMQAEETR